MAYNIQMNYFDGSVYQELYPRTLKENIVDYNLVEIINYTGTGNYNNTHPSVLLFSNNPKFVIIQNTMKTLLGVTLFFNITGMSNEQSQSYAYNEIYEYDVIHPTLNWGMYSPDDKKLVWYSIKNAEEQANYKDYTYTAIAFY